jgi:glutamate racemase
VLGTQATVGREYTRALIREFADGCDVHLVGSPRLASYAEAELAGNAVDDAAIRAQTGDCFIDVGARRTDTIVLACTHYPLLVERFRAVAPWTVDWLDPAPAIARRVADLLRERPPDSTSSAQAIEFTSGRPASPALKRALATFGF